jgi:hypothetical protein
MGASWPLARSESGGGFTAAEVVQSDQDVVPGDFLDLDGLVHLESLDKRGVSKHVMEEEAR